MGGRGRVQVVEVGVRVVFDYELVEIYGKTCSLRNKIFYFNFNYKNYKIKRDLGLDFS